MCGIADGTVFGAFIEKYVLLYNHGRDAGGTDIVKHGGEELPVISIITVSYNSINNLRISLGLLKKQDYPFIESIIIDGCSTDGSREYIERFAREFVYESDDISHSCKWISEKDSGLYDAINKGIDMASGDIIGCYWDMYETDHVISDMVDIILSENTDGVHGDLLYVDENGKTVRKWKTGQGNIRHGWMPGHPTLYLKSEIYEKYGHYNTEYRISADFEFMVRCLKDGDVKLSYIPHVLIRMFYGGTSNNGLAAYMDSTKEAYLALKSNHVKPAGWIVFLRILKTIMQFQMK